MDARVELACQPGVQLTRRLLLSEKAVLSLEAGPVIRQLPFPGLYHFGMSLVLTVQLANRLAAFERFQRNPKLAGRRVSPPFLDHRSAPPQAR